jgi:hypothetical protein
MPRKLAYTRGGNCNLVCASCGQACKRVNKSGLCSACNYQAKCSDRQCNSNCKRGNFATCRVLSLVGAGLPCFAEDFSEAYAITRSEYGAQPLTRAHALVLVARTPITPIAWTIAGKLARSGIIADEPQLPGGEKW